MALSASSRIGVTADETAHLTAGYTYWTTHDYRLQPENGNFPQRWAALPLLSEHYYFPALPDIAWQNSDVWNLGRQFFFQSHNDPAAMLWAGRAMMVVLGVALVGFASLWSRQLFGRTGGLLTLGFLVFCPHLLAHSALITSDIAATLGFMIALAAWWRLCHRITVGRVLAAGAAMGFLALAKYSAALFAPIAIALALVRLFRRTPLPCQFVGFQERLIGAKKFAGLLSAGGIAAGVAVIVIWGAYGFRYAASGDPEHRFSKPWAEVLIEEPKVGGSTMVAEQTPADPVELRPGIVQAFVQTARAFQLLPEAYLYGLAFTDLHARGRLAYFAGDYRETGWWEFFPVAFVLKTTLPSLLLFALALLAFALAQPARRARWIYRLSPLLIFVGIYWAFAITSHLNIGHRHLLPIYPALLIMAGVLGSRIITLRHRGWMIVASLLLVWHVVESVCVRPHYLTYFNELAGGPTGGHRYFVDSSLDWGQGLPDLESWLASHPTTDPVYLSYFGSDEPARFNFQATRIGDFYFDFSNRRLFPPLAPGVYCFSATMLHRVYTQVRGPWSASYERAYQNLPAEINALDLTRDATTRETLLIQLEQLRFGRLCHYLERREPDAIVANSIHVYRLSDADLDHALHGPVWVP